MVVDILGTKYEVVQSDLNDPDMSDCDGVCKSYAKSIKIRSKEYMLLQCDDDVAKEKRLKDVIRHELVHAFAHESGVSYDDDEQLVDWIARTIPKIEAAYSKIFVEMSYDNK